MTSRSFIKLHDGPSRFTRFWLDEYALADGYVCAPDGTCEQCPGCGSVMSESCKVDLRLRGTKITCACGEVYVVEKEDK